MVYNPIATSYKKYLLAVFLLQGLPVSSQDKGIAGAHPVKTGYGVSAYEFIFSFGNVSNAGQKLDNVVRFTPVFNPQHQAHYNFSGGSGMYTGIGIRNVGFINKIAGAPGEEITLKQRAYSLGIPLAMKLGNMKGGTFLALGAEAELMFHYKKKIQEGGHSSNTSSWFSSEVNTFNPSLFAELRFHSGTFLRFRYYLNDFLKNQDMSFYLPDSGTQVSYTPVKSTLFYFSIGTAFKIRKKKHLTREET